MLYWDIGYYSQVGEAGVATPAPSGIVTATGLGITLDFLDLATGALYLTWRLDAPNANGTVVGSMSSSACTSRAAFRPFVASAAFAVRGYAFGAHGTASPS